MVCPCNEKIPHFYCKVETNFKRTFFVKLKVYAVYDTLIAYVITVKSWFVHVMKTFRIFTARLKPPILRALFLVKSVYDTLIAKAITVKIWFVHVMKKFRIFTARLKPILSALFLVKLKVYDTLIAKVITVKI